MSKNRIPLLNSYTTYVKDFSALTGINAAYRKPNTKKKYDIAVDDMCSKLSELIEAVYLDNPSQNNDRIALLVLIENYKDLLKPLYGNSENISKTTIPFLTVFPVAQLNFSI